MPLVSRFALDPLWSGRAADIERGTRERQRYCRSDNFSQASSSCYLQLNGGTRDSYGANLIFSLNLLCPADASLEAPANARGERKNFTPIKAQNEATRRDSDATQLEA